MTNYDNDKVYSELAEKILEICSSKSKKNHKDILDNIENNKENFLSNLQQIIKNPASLYNEKVSLFKEIPELEVQKNNLTKEITKFNEEKTNLATTIDKNKELLESEKNKFNEEIKSLKNTINGNKDSNDDLDKMGLVKYKELLESEITKLNQEKTSLAATIKESEIKVKSLQEELDGNKNIQEEDDKRANLGLIKYKKLLEKNIEKLEINISSLEINNRELKKSKSDLERDYAVAENLAGLKEESKSHVKLYGIFLFCAIIALGVIMYCSYTYGIGILSDLKELSKPPSTRASSDYFGLFLLKLPFALLMGLGISGIVIFLNKILMLIERINNQQRSISQIIVIAKQIDETTINLIKNENSEEYQNAKKEKDEKNLFYKLITNHLVSISKNEMELQNKNNDTMKTLKEFSNIIKGVTPIGEKK